MKRLIFSLLCLSLLCGCTGPAAFAQTDLLDPSDLTSEQMDSYAQTFLDREDLQWADNQQTKAQLFDGKQDRIVLFIQDGCEHCQHLEAALTKAALPATFMLYNLTGSSMERDVLNPLLESYEVSLDEFGIRGTPCLVMQKAGSQTLECTLGVNPILEALYA